MKRRAPMLLNHLRTGEDKTMYSGTKSKAGSLRHKARIFMGEEFVTSIHLHNKFYVNLLFDRTFYRPMCTHMGDRRPHRRNSIMQTLLKITKDRLRVKPTKTAQLSQEVGVQHLGLPRNQTINQWQTPSRMKQTMNGEKLLPQLWRRAKSPIQHQVITLRK